MSLAEFTVVSKCAAAHVKKLLVWEFTQPDHTGPCSPQAGVTVPPAATGTVSWQLANAAPFLVPEKSTVILSSIFGVAGSLTETLLLTVHDDAPLQSGWKRIFWSGLTTACGSTAPCRPWTSPCSTVKTGPMVAAVSGVTLKE